MSLKGQMRIVRIPLEPRLIREIDRLISEGIGGYESRAELIRDAVEALLLELAHPPADDPPRLRDQPIAHAGDEPRKSQPPGLTGILPPPRGSVLGDMGIRAGDGSLFGLHNRDYPSIWALARLAEAARDEPVGLTEFFSNIGEAAWAFADGLNEGGADRKLLALFPTNPAKKLASQKAYVTFAIGSVGEARDEVFGDGPLFLWRAAAVERRDGEIVIAPTATGYELLEAMSGVSIEQPHTREQAELFLGFLRRYAAGDFWGFVETVRAIGEGATRQELVSHFEQLRPAWTENMVATNAAGYLARCREWGLVKPAQHRRRYLLTDCGNEFDETERSR